MSENVRALRVPPTAEEAYDEWWDCEDDDERRYAAKRHGLSFEEFRALAGKHAAARPKRLAEINRLCHLDPPGVTAVRRLVGTTPQRWEIEGPRRTVTATTRQLAEFRYCKVLIADAVGQVPDLGPKDKRARWDDVWRAFVDTAEDVELDPEGGQIVEWLQAYLETWPPLPQGEAREDFLTRRPFVEGGAVHVFTTGLRDWLRLSKGERVDRTDLLLLLREVGGEVVKPFMLRRPDGRRTSTTVVRLPDGWSA